MKKRLRVLFSDLFMCRALLATILAKIGGEVVLSVQEVIEVSRQFQFLATADEDQLTITLSAQEAFPRLFRPGEADRPQPHRPKGESPQPG